MGPRDRGVVVGAIALAIAACGVASNGSSLPDRSSSSSSGGGDDGSTSSSGGSSGETVVPPVPGGGTSHAGCSVFPKDNPWNQDISGLPVDTALMASVMPQMSLGTGMHPDWGTESDGYGIPITVGRAASPPAKLTFHTDYGEEESDKLPCPGGGGDFCYPIPLDAKVEGGSDAPLDEDRHILFLATDGAPSSCVLYELYSARNPANGGFQVGSAAIWHLDSNDLRTEGFTSADAAGLPIMAGLVRREEVVRGEITHAIRFTMDRTRQAFIHPATHAAGEDDDSLPPMGLRLRLKASFDESALSRPTQIVVKAMKRYGIILADNGSDWYISGESDEAWADDMDALVPELKTVKGSDFEIVKTGDVIVP